MDAILRNYILWVKSPKTNPWGAELPYTMARPLLCAAIAWNVTFERYNVQGTAAWKLVYDYEKYHVKGEPVRISQEDFGRLFQDIIELFNSLQPPYREDKEGKQHFWDTAGILVLVVTCILLYRVGNILDVLVAALIHEAPLEELISFYPDSSNPSHLIFSTKEKTDKAKKLVMAARSVKWPCNEGWVVLDPLPVLDKYLEAHGMTRDSMHGPIQKVVGRAGQFNKNSFTRQDYRKWLKKLVIREVTHLPSLRKDNLLPSVLRRTSMAYYANVTDIHTVQALAGHKHVSTTANSYVGLEEEDLACVRASSAYSLLGIIQTRKKNFLFSFILFRHGTSEVQPLDVRSLGKAPSEASLEPSKKRQCASLGALEDSKLSIGLLLPSSRAEKGESLSLDLGSPLFP